jgi:hypothetical protein
MDMAKNLIGSVSHYYPRINVAVVDLSKPLKIGDKISIEGATTKMVQIVESMQVEHKNVSSAGPGDSVGMKVNNRVRPGDNIFVE